MSLTVYLRILRLMRSSPTWGLRSESGWQPAGKIDGLLYVINVYSSTVGALLAAVLAVAVGFLLYHRALRFHAFGFVLLAVGAVVYMAMPRVIFDTYMADQRLPISLAFMVIACAQLDLRRLGLRHPFVGYGAVAVLFLVLSPRAL